MKLDTLARTAGITLIAMTLAGCHSRCDNACDSGPPDEDTGPEVLALFSKSFDDGEQIPVSFSCDGDDLSPRMYWAGIPAEVASWALIMIDMDASDTPHWAIYDLPADTSWLAEGASPGGVQPAGVIELTNFRGTVGYAGPCPPAEHHYRFTLYALGENSLGVSSDASFGDLEAAAQAVLIDSVSMTGVYGGERP